VPVSLALIPQIIIIINLTTCRMFIQY
jgi:hypothetical protein